jgi:XTP/dITP diphosphohydrolase
VAELQVFGLGLGAGEAPLPERSSPGQAFVPDAAELLRLRLQERGWRIRSLCEVTQARTGDAVYLLGAPEPADPVFQRLRKQGGDLVVHPGQSLLHQLGAGAAVLSAQEFAAATPVSPAVVLGLPVKASCPRLLPGARVIRVRAERAPEELLAAGLRLEDFSPGDALLVPKEAVPACRELARLLVLMATLRAPGGCPWDREQTHLSLRPYLLEEAAEAVDALSAGDLHRITEELGDLLLQVVFHSEIGREEGTFSLEDVAGAIADKLVRRHPHVFQDTNPLSPEGVVRQWHELKRGERVRAPSAEVPSSFGALERAEKLASILRRHGLETEVEADFLWRQVSEAQAQGRMLSLELRAVVDRLLARLDRLGDPAALSPAERRRRWGNDER